MRFPPFDRQDIFTLLQDNIKVKEGKRVIPYPLIANVILREKTLQQQKKYRPKADFQTKIDHKLLEDTPSITSEKISQSIGTVPMRL